jgi:hypothetical protein
VVFSYAPLSRPFVLVTLVVVLSACEREEPKPDSEPTPTAEHDAPAAPAAPTAAPKPANGCGPIDELAAMDTRRPVPLQPMMAWHQKQNMMEHLVAIQRIVAGVAEEDWDEIAEAAALIESSPQMKTMCQHMGAGAEGFTELALSFHERADEIGPAAESQDGAAVLRATSKTLEVCTSCHATYRQDVVDAKTWQARTGSSHDPAAMHSEAGQ